MKLERGRVYLADDCCSTISTSVLTPKYYCCSKGVDVMLLPKLAAEDDPLVMRTKVKFYALCCILVFL